MKKALFIILAALPLFTLAQQKCNYFDYVTIKTDKTQINTTQSDFGPSFVEDELWYSAYTAEEIEKLEKGKSKKIYYNLFSTPVDENGNLLTGKTARLAEASKNYHAGPVSYCEATKELFVTLSNYDNYEVRNKVYRKADLSLRIAILKHEDGNWKIKSEFPYNSSKYSVGHPAVSVTGDTLFFASNMPNGSGKTDIYMSVRDGENWGKPVNLGNKVNTSGDEMFPVILNSNILVYSSNGMGSGADLDFYYTCFSNEGFSNPMEVKDLNSDADDFGLTVHSNQQIGYYTSNKKDGEGNDDIYRVEFEGQYELELIVMDRNENIPVPDALVNFDDGVKGKLVDMLITRKLDKNSTIVATTEIPGYMNGSATITTKGKPYGIVKDTIWVEKVKVEQKIVLANIYFDFDKWDILPESEVELDDLVQILKDNPTWNIELGSHTDCRGTDQYNDELSQKRSDSVVDYIIGKGIAKDRIIAKGYGESELVNDCDDGVDCTEEEHRLNRRTEFKIVKM
jgi:outer membrane protein OmpA-like peptidoglycan-associated protein